MFKKTMKFDDLEGNEVEQTFYFNYNKKELAELLEFGQLEERLAKLGLPVSESGLSQVENNQQAYDIFQDLILGSYGEKGADNVTFVKNDALRDYWKHHVAFVELIFEFLEKPSLAAEFIENCFPAKLVAKAKEDLQSQAAGTLTGTTITEMVEEAERRQQDPATRIEPKVTTPIETSADEAVPAKLAQELTGDDIREMDDIAFKKLNVQNLSKDAMYAAFQRKNQS